MNLYNKWQEASDECKYDITPMSLLDEERINQILLKELGLMPALSELNDVGTVRDFMDTGYSFVARKDSEVVGVMLAQRIMDYGSYYILINNFAVAESSQGLGIGKAMMYHLCCLAEANKIHKIVLNTKKTLKAYDIYHHWGFEDQDDNWISMKKWVMRGKD